MNQRQWQEVEAIVRKEQTVALQHMNNKRYDELREILDELYKLAHDWQTTKPNSATGLVTSGMFFICHCYHHSRILSW